MKMEFDLIEGVRVCREVRWNEASRKAGSDKSWLAQDNRTKAGEKPRYNETMIPKPLEGVLVSDPDTLSGAIRFVGTRVPVSTLFDYVLGGDGVEEFMADFPGVSRELIQAVLDWERNRLGDDLGLGSVA